MRLARQPLQHVRACRRIASRRAAADRAAVDIRPTDRRPDRRRSDCDRSRVHDPAPSLCLCLSLCPSLVRARGRDLCVRPVGRGCGCVSVAIRDPDCGCDCGCDGCGRDHDRAMSIDPSLWMMAGKVCCSSRWIRPLCVCVRQSVCLLRRSPAKKTKRKKKKRKKQTELQSHRSAW